MFNKKYNKIIVNDDCAVIKISNNLLGELDCIIDKSDILLVKDYYWNVRFDKRHPNCTLYVETRYKGKRIHLHRLLTACPENKVVDHIDGNGLNNKKSNLKICSQSENSLNRHHKEYMGVSYNKRDNLWIAYIRIQGKTKYLGYYETELEAIKKRKEIDTLVRKGLLQTILDLKCEKIKRTKKIA